MREKANANTTRSSGGGRRRKGDGGDNGKWKTLKDWFEEEYKCLVCGQNVKTSLRLRHEKSCHVPSDDDEVLFLEEIRVKPTAGLERVVTSMPHETRKAVDESTDKEEPWSKRLRTRRSADASSSSATPVVTVADVAVPPEASTATVSVTSNNIPAIVDICDTDVIFEPALNAKNVDSGLHVSGDADANAEADVSKDLFDDSKTGESEDEETDPNASNTSFGIPTLLSVRSLATTSTSTTHSVQQSMVVVEEAGSGFQQSGDVTMQLDDQINSLKLPDLGRSPFAFKAFMDILHRVYNDDFHAHLFNEEDRRTIDGFLKLPDNAQLLYCRLIMRKDTWQPVEALKRTYGSMPNIEKAVRALNREKLLDSCDKLDDVSELLNVMQLPQLQKVAKGFLRPKEIQGKKEALIKKLLEFTKSQASLNGSMKSTLLKRAKTETGECYRVADEAYTLFVCIWHLFSPKDMSSSQAADKRFGTVSKLIGNLVHILWQKNSEQLQFVSRTGIRQVHQFRTREDLRRYVQASILELHVASALENKNYEECVAVGAQALEELKTLLDDEQQDYEQIPSQLRPYTVIRVLFRIIGYGATALEKQKRYNEAAEVFTDLTRILPSHFWCPTHRSQWYVRLALLLDVHLKMPEDAFEIIEAALEEDTLAEDVRLTLTKRAKKITKSLISKATTSEEKDELTRRLAKLTDGAPEVNIVKRMISASLLRKTLGGKRKTIFASVNDQDGSVTARNVEAVAKAYYIEGHDFTDGIHAEGSPWLLLYGLFFWDIIHDSDIPDAFICSQQWGPLDLTDPRFYSRRKPNIDKRLEWIRSNPLEVLIEAVEATWQMNRGKASALVNWDLFNGFEQVKGLINSIGGKILADVLSRLASHYRNFRSGFPDLLLWNTVNKTFKVVEVKGPGDQLSAKQQLWLDYFVKIGASAEVCHVKGIPGKLYQKNGDD